MDFFYFSVCGGGGGVTIMMAVLFHPTIYEKYYAQRFTMLLSQNVHKLMK